MNEKVQIDLMNTLISVIHELLKVLDILSSSTDDKTIRKAK